MSEPNLSEKMYGRPQDDEPRATVKLNGAENVILRFDGPGMDEPFMWGFASIRDWRTYLKMLVRFDETLSGDEGV